MKFQEASPKEKMKETETQLRKVWQGIIPTAYSCISMTPNYRQLEDDTHQAELAAENILLNAQYPGFNPPRVIADFGTVSTAKYWGGTVRLPVGGCLSIEPIIFHPEDAGKFQPEKPEDGDAGKGTRLFRKVCEKLDTEDLYCSTVDFQGPLTTAALLWEQTDFMTSMITEPEAVHRLLDRVTTHLIELIRYSIQSTGGKICANVWPFIWLPSDLGVGITEDYMPLLSADMYREFGIPYVERISREFGGLFIHCCGEYGHQIENLINSDIQLLGLEFHYPYTSPEKLFKAFGDSVLFVPYLGPKGYDTFRNKTEYFQYLKDIRQENTRLWFLLAPEEEDFESQLKVVQGMVEA